MRATAGFFTMDFLNNSLLNRMKTLRELAPAFGMRWHACIALPLIFALTACGGGADPSADKPAAAQPIFTQGRLDPALKGPWRMLGTGQLVDWKDDGLHLFQEVKSRCYPDPQTLQSHVIDGFLFTKKQENEKTTVEIHASANTPSAVTLERVKEIPAHCRQPMSASHSDIFNVFWDIFDLDYAFFKERGIHWNERKAELEKLASAAQSAQDLQKIFVKALGDFNDYHTGVMHAENGTSVSYFNSGNTASYKMLRQAFEQQSDVDSLDEFQLTFLNGIQQSAMSRLGSSSGKLLNGALLWGVLPGNVGYIGLSQEIDYADGSNITRDRALIAAEMDRAISALQGTQALVLDLSVNNGGADAVSAEVAGRFADRRRLAFTTRSHRPQGRAAQDWYVEPRGTKQYLKPVYLLTSDLTISAGETLTLMMRELPHVVHVGQPTAGSQSNKLEKSLPGPFHVTLSHEINTDSRGIVHEGRGIPPTVPVVIFDPADPQALTHGHGRALDKVLELIGR